jgi:hypothetical protein
MDIKTIGKIYRLVREYKDIPQNNVKELDLRHKSEKEQLLFSRGYKDGYLACINKLKDIIDGKL